MLVLQCGLENSILPVCSLTKNRGVGIDGVRVAKLTCICKVIVETSVFTQIHDVKTLCLARNGKHAIIRNLGIASLTTLCSNKHNTVGTLCTIDGSSRGVFQNLHAHDVGRVDGGKRRNGRYLTVSESIAETE